MVGIDDVVREEWRQFQLVNNEGGRAGCQDNETEFYIMRKSQFMAWREEIVDSYYRDLMQAKSTGRNLLFEKYAFMMKDTAPQKYAALKSFLPEISPKKSRLIREIVDIQVRWAEDFRRRYPVYAGNGRPVRTSEEKAYETSVETYSRGELSSYGEKTIELYADYVRACEREGRNLTDIVRENMAKMYGYDSLEDIESKLKASMAL